MPKMAKPLSRPELEKLLVSDADAFTALRYLRHREQVPALPELEEKGKSQFPGAEGILADLYYTLWDSEPSVKQEVEPDRRYWQQLLEQTIVSSAYQELHGYTQLSELKSILGTVSMGETILQTVPEEDKEKLQGLGQAQQEAAAAEELAQEAEANAQALQQLADQIGQGETLGQPQQGQVSEQSSGVGKMSPEEAKQLANELAKAQADANSAREMADEAKAQAENLAQDLLGAPGTPEAEEKLRELARIGLAATRQAQEKVEEISDTIESWGLKEAELLQEGIPEALGLLERMKRSDALKKFSSLLGRIRKIAARKAGSRQKGEGARVAIPETGRDIKRAERREIVALLNPALRAKALSRWTRGELRLRGQQARPKLGYGPVIVCEDGSGSMEGAKQQWAKATTLALAYYAKLQKRSFGWVMFDYGVRRSASYQQGNVPAKAMLEIAESKAGGGTNFEKPLTRALEMVRQEGLKKADICLITDGHCEVSDEFLRELREAKKSLEINVFTVICDVGSVSDATVKQFSDKVERVSSFSSEEAERAVFRNL